MIDESMNHSKTGENQSHPPVENCKVLASQNTKPQKRLQFYTARAQPANVEKMSKRNGNFQCFPPRSGKLPRVASLDVEAKKKEQDVPATETIKSLLRATPFVVAVHIDTHDKLNRRMKWWRGPFGFWNLTAPDVFDQARIVQIGWSILKDNDEPITKQLLVQPRGFEITPAATDKHKITNDNALKNGTQLQNVLQEFIDDITKHWNPEGRLVAHHLEFNANIISKELERQGLHHLNKLWHKIVSDGACTMDPDIAHWVRNRFNMEQVEYKSAISLKTMMQKLCPNCDADLQKDHSAGGDAQMTAMVYRELCKRAQGKSENK